VRAPLLIGWAGGPKAAALSALNHEELRDLSVRIIAGCFGMKPATLRRLLVSCWTHDWQRDPFARGSYSYSAVGGKDADKTLARPVGRTLFFAGEAASGEGRNGTVDGAIATGYQAARRVIRALHA
jgi:monoamine oxidase